MNFTSPCSGFSFWALITYKLSRDYVITSPAVTLYKLVPSTITYKSVTQEAWSITHTVQHNTSNKYHNPSCYETSNKYLYNRNVDIVSKYLNGTSLSNVNNCILIMAFITYLFQFHNSVYLTKYRNCKYFKVTSAMPVHMVETTYQNALSWILVALICSQSRSVLQYINFTLLNDAFFSHHSFSNHETR